MHTNQRLLVEELGRRGVRCRVVDEKQELVELSWGGRVELMMDRAGSRVPFLASALAADKHLAKSLMRKAGLPVPDGELFGRGQLDEALAYGEALGYPLVAKPNSGSHGDGVRSGLRCAGELEVAICELLLEGFQSFIVERHVEGSEHRVFATSLGYCAVLEREPASVVGDGVCSIRDLAMKESVRRAREKSLGKGNLCPLALDAISQRHLARSGLSFDSVPKAGDRVSLRLSSNLAKGGFSRDKTAQAHQSVLDMGRAALKIFDGLPCIGIDLVTTDIGADQAAVGGCLLEANSNPGLSMHHMPGEGPSRDVAKALADAMFPGFGTAPK